MFASYLRKYWAALAMPALFAALFALLLYLNGTEAGVLWYTLLLCAFFELCALGIGFGLYRRRHRQLQQVCAGLPHSVEELPRPADLLEADYQQMLRLLYEQRARTAAAADRARTEMVDYYTLWAHQIKTPIAAMRLLLQTEQLPAQQELALELFRVEQYADMVLQYLRLQSESSDFVFRRTPLDEIARRAVKKYARVFIRSQVTLRYTPPAGQVLTDEKWLGFVLEQLLSNALKYTPQGTVSVFSPEEGVLVIQDTGIGIAPEDLPRICQRGFTGYNGRTEQKSTGLGLFLCRQILRQLGHGMEIRSAPGEGTTVRLDLRAVQTIHE